MQVEAIGQVGRPSDLQLGECFFLDQGRKTTFAIHTADGHGHKAAIVFSREGGNRLPWVLAGGLPSTILIVRRAQIRTDPSSLVFSNSLPLGNIVAVGESFYIAAALRTMESVTINLQTGMTEDIPLTGMYVHFARWSVGILEGERWIPIFEFPLVESTSG